MIEPKITLTDTATAQFREIKEAGMYPRLTMIKSGCCSFKLEIYPDKLRGEDKLYPVNDEFSIIIEERALILCDTLTIDYRRNGLFRSFIIQTY